MGCSQRQPRGHFKYFDCESIAHPGHREYKVAQLNSGCSLVDHRNEFIYPIIRFGEANANDAAFNANSQNHSSQCNASEMIAPGYVALEPFPRKISTSHVGPGYFQSRVHVS
jgi:hypothetical protein